MSWDRDRQVLSCDHRAPRGASGTPAAEVEMVPCQEVALASTAAVARSKARARGWQTNASIGDRCGQHRVGATHPRRPGRR